MAKVFWDTNLFVYLFEEHPVFGPQVAGIRQRMRQRGDHLYTSTLAVGEILAGPLREGDSDLFQRYRAFFKHPSLQVVTFDLRAAEAYAAIRLDRGIKPPDAIHLACAAAAGADLFITNDEALSRRVIAGINFIATLARAPL